MDDNELEKINIPIDEENPDAQFQEDVEKSQAVRLNRRITRTSFLIITLMGVVILFAYIDLKKSLSKMNSSGNTEIQSLAEGMQSKFSSLLSQQAKLEEVLSEKIIPLEKAVGSMQTDLKEISTAIKQIRSARDSDNKETAGAIEAIHKTLTPVPTKIEQLTSDIDRFTQKYTNELSSLSRMTTNLQNHIQKLQSDLDMLSSSQLNKKILDIELSNERSNNQKSLNQLKSDMANRLLLIEKKLKGIEKITTSLEEQITIKPTEARPSQSQKLNTVDNDAHRQSGTIIEQDIQYHGHGNTTSDPN